jgi:hypothetical protein
VKKFRLELRPRDGYGKTSSNMRIEEEVMVHPVHGADPDKARHRTYKSIEPEGEVAVVQRPEGTVKILFYTCSGADKTCHTEVLLDHQEAFNLAMEILQQAYRTVGGEK